MISKHTNNTLKTKKKNGAFFLILLKRLKRLGRTAPPLCFWGGVCYITPVKKELLYKQTRKQPIK